MIEKGILFGNLHSFWDLDLILAEAIIPPASPKETYVDIPGADGSVDMTEAHGEVKYSDRTGAKFTFYMNPAGDLSDAAWEEKKTQISNLLNGLRCNITLDKDPDYYWQGRCKVNDHASNKKLHKFVVGARLAPYKLKNDVTNVFVPLCGKNLLDTSPDNQISQLYGDVEYITNGFRKSGSYFVGFRAYVQKNTQYFISCDIAKIVQASLPGNGGRMAIYDTTNTKSIAHFSSAEGHAIFTFNSGNYTEINVLFYSDSDQDIGVYEFTNIQIEAGQATEYEAFTPVESKDITLTNARKTVCPSIVVTDEATVTVSGDEFVLAKGTHKVLDLQLHEGETPVTVSGTGAVYFVYQERDL